MFLSGLNIASREMCKLATQCRINLMQNILKHKKEIYKNTNCINVTNVRNHYNPVSLKDETSLLKCQTSF